MTPIVEQRRSTLGIGNMTGAKSSSDSTRPSLSFHKLSYGHACIPAADPVKSSRLLAMQYQGSFDESADGYLLPVIEEGIADGSIACECPREAAEAVSLLANLWLLPLFRPLEPKERMLARAQCLAQMAAAVGLDLGEEVLQTTAQIWDVWDRAGW